MCGADCWPVSKSGREKILASDSSSEFPRPLYLLELKKTKSEIKVEKWKKILMLIMLITCRAKLLNADWLRQRAFFLNQEGTFGNQEGMIT